MYLSQQIERFLLKTTYAGQQPRFRLIAYRVQLDDSGRPIWKLHRQVGDYYNDAEARLNRLKNVPLLSSPAPNKKVTMGEAVRLTGLKAPAALDYLTENVSDSPVLQNYVKPKKVKEPKPEPTPLEVAYSKASLADSKVEEYDRRIRRLELLRAKWVRKARAQRTRISKLEEPE